jgi:hypothetical protein
VQKPLTESQFRTVSKGGICIKGPTSAVSLVGEAVTPSSEKTSTGGSAPLLQNLNVDIPGFVIPEKASELFSTYMISVYRYGISIAAIAATIVFIYGAFLYLLQIKGKEDVMKGKTVMKDAIIGMLLVFSAALIARTLNPELLRLNQIEIVDIKTLSAFPDVARERARVEDAARKSKTGLVKMPVIDIESGEVTSLEDKLPKEAKEKVDDLAKDEFGNLIAQGECPSDMLPILRSEEYKRAEVPPFCIDRYEAPNRQGVQPFLGVNEWESDFFCDAIGKRLCNSDEWVRACMGPRGDNMFGFGNKYVPGKNISQGGQVIKTGGEKAPCNYDTNPGQFVNSGTDKKVRTHFWSARPWPEASILFAGNQLFTMPKYKEAYDIMIKEIERLRGTEPSGSRAGCITEEGVIDMVGNAQEITVKGTFKNTTLDQRIRRGTKAGENKAYAWLNFYWYPIAHLASPDALPGCTQGWGGVHDIGWRGFENGFRCCMNLQP